MPSTLIILAAGHDNASTVQSTNERVIVVQRRIDGLGHFVVGRVSINQSPTQPGGRITANLLHGNYAYVQRPVQKWLVEKVGERSDTSSWLSVEGLAVLKEISKV